MMVDVYFNLHRRLFSMRSHETGRVIGHYPWACVVDATFVVQPAGRQRVLDSGVKNVHAFVRGTSASAASATCDRSTACRVSYNPCKAPWFVEPNAYDAAYHTDKPLSGARAVLLEVVNGRPQMLAWGEQGVPGHPECM